MKFNFSARERSASPQSLGEWASLQESLRLLIFSDLRWTAVVFMGCTFVLTLVRRYLDPSVLPTSTPQLIAQAVGYGLLLLLVVSILRMATVPGCRIRAQGLLVFFWCVFAYGAYRIGHTALWLLPGLTIVTVLLRYVGRPSFTHAQSPSLKTFFVVVSLPALFGVGLVAVASWDPSAYAVSVWARTLASTILCLTLVSVVTYLSDYLNESLGPVRNLFIEGAPELVAPQVERLQVNYDQLEAKSYVVCAVVFFAAMLLVPLGMLLAGTSDLHVTAASFVGLVYLAFSGWTAAAKRRLTPNFRKLMTALASVIPVLFINALPNDPLLWVAVNMAIAGQLVYGERAWRLPALGWCFFILLIGLLQSPSLFAYLMVGAIAANTWVVLRLVASRDMQLEVLSDARLVARVTRSEYNLAPAVSQFPDPKWSARNKEAIKQAKRVAGVVFLVTFAFFTGWLLLYWYPALTLPYLMLGMEVAAVASLLLSIVAFWIARGSHTNSLERELATYRRELELTEELVVAKEAAEGALAELGHSNAILEGERHKAIADAREHKEFLATVGQELTAPLNGVFSALSGIQSLDSDPTAVAYAETGLENAERALTMLHDLMEYSHLSSGYLVLTPGTVNLYDLIHRISRMPKFKARSEVLFAVNVDESCDTQVRIDEVRLTQVLEKLLQNAVYHTDHGSVTLDVALTETHKPQAKITMVVRDTGKGMDDALRGGLFKPFNYELQRHYSGTGLGLSIVKLIWDAMGGTIRVDSGLGQGTTFTLEAPITQGRPKI